MFKKFFFIFLSVFYFVFPICVFAGSEDDTEELNNPLNTSDPQIIIGNIINAVFGIVGSVALLMFVYGGFMWMLAAGNSDRVEKGKNIIVWATLGLVVIFTSYAIVNFIFSDILKVT